MIPQHMKNYQRLTCCRRLSHRRQQRVLLEHRCFQHPFQEEVTGQQTHDKTTGIYRLLEDEVDVTILLDLLQNLHRIPEHLEHMHSPPLMQRTFIGRC